MICFFVTDLHGHRDRYQKLFTRIEKEPPRALFIGGDILPHGLYKHTETESAGFDFIKDFLAVNLARLKEKLGAVYPEIFLILGNDDGRAEEHSILDIASRGLWHYAHNRQVPLEDYVVYGYAYVPPSPFQIKDWERYDVSRYVDPGCISPEEGFRTVPVTDYEKKYTTIAKDLKALFGEVNLNKAICLFHTPPYKTKLDRAALDGIMVDSVPMDVHTGSVAVAEFIKKLQPLATLHGHIHESARLTGSWKDKIGQTHCFSAAHDGPELALVKFDPGDLEKAERELI